MTEVLQSIFTWDIILYNLIGIILGTIVGSIPGLSVTMSLAILTPFTFVLNPLEGLAMLLGVYNSGVWAGGISAILINTPGTPASIMTTLDGYALTKQNKGIEALLINTVYSVVGGIFGTIVLLLAATPLAKFALKFGPMEYFALSIFGLSMMVSISQGHKLKGLLMGIIGLLLSTFGIDPLVGVPRYTFDSVELLQGVSFIAVMIGLFGFSEVLYQISESTEESHAEQKIDIVENISIIDILKKIHTIPISFLVGLQTCIISVITGAIPGAGGDIASIISWNEGKKISKEKKLYGKGSKEALAVTCMANNCVIGGTMTTMLTLGIPGDAATSVLIGALLSYGMRPGPTLFINNMDFVNNIIGLLFLSNIFILILGILTTNIYGKILKIKKEFLWIIIISCSIIGVYSVSNSFFEVGTMLAFGILGFAFKHFSFPMGPLVLGLILGRLAESNLRRSLFLTEGNFSPFFQSPIVLFFIAILGVTILVNIRESKNKQRSQNE